MLPMSELTCTTSPDGRRMNHRLYVRESASVEDAVRLFYHATQILTARGSLSLNYCTMTAIICIKEAARFYIAG